MLITELDDYAIFLIDLSGRITSWNAGVERILGYGEEEFLGKPISILFVPEDVAAGAPEKEIETAIRESRAPDRRWHVRDDGTRLFVDGVLAAVKSPDGALIGLSKVMHDITEQKRLEDELQARLDRTTEILESISDAFYAVDSDFCLTYVNRKAEELWNRKREDLIGAELWNEFPSTIGSEFYHHHLAAMRTRQPVRFEALSAVLQRWISVNIYPESSGGLSCYFQDISARKQAESERENLLSNLFRSNEDLSQFSYVVSHDLQTPLRMVKSYAQLLEKRCKENLDPAGQEFLSYVLDGAQQMETLIHGLLAYSQFSEAPEKQTDVSLENLLQGVLANFKQAIQDAEATVTHDPLPVIQGDPVQVLQVLQNLVGNALKYRRSDAPAQVHISAVSMDREWLISVRDNGVGIDRKFAETIFLPLQRLHGADIPGSGIGLAICKKIVERSGGRIWVESKLGQGSTFFFTIPPPLFNGTEQSFSPDSLKSKS